MKRRAESGYATVLVLGLALVALGVAALAVDGTRAFLFRMSLQNAADSAALAGASEIDRDQLYAAGGSHVSLDPDAARARALDWVRRRGVLARVGVEADREVVRVALRGTLRTTFLRMIGIGAIPVGAEAVATPVAGAR